jgi:phage terminase large subunit-like protein
MENPVGFWGIDELLDQIFKYQERYQCRKVGLEKTLAYTAMGKLLEDRMEREGKNFQVIELPLIGNANKVARAQVMVPYIKNGLLRFPTIDGQLTYDADRTIQQFKSFPLGRLNDIVDSNAHMFHRDMGLVEGSGMIERPERPRCANPVMSQAQYDLYLSDDAGAGAYSLDPGRN